MPAGAARSREPPPATAVVFEFLPAEMRIVVRCADAANEQALHEAFGVQSPAPPAAEAATGAEAPAEAEAPAAAAPVGGGEQVGDGAAEKVAETKGQYSCAPAWRHFLRSPSLVAWTLS